MVSEDPAVAKDEVGAARDFLALGNFGRCRQILLRLRRAGTLSPEGQELLDRFRPDPLVNALSIGCLIFFLAVVWKTLR